MIRINRTSNGTHNVDGELPAAQNVRKKPIIVQAIRMDEPFLVDTIEGTMKGKAGDWLMIGVEGEMYPCDAGIFEKTYDIIGRVSKRTRKQLEALQNKYKCKGCVYRNKYSKYTGLHCGYKGKLNLDSKNEKCLTRKESDDEIEAGFISEFLDDDHRYGNQ